MSTTSKTVENYEGIDSNKENNNVLNKEEENNNNDNDVKQQAFHDAINNVRKKKVTLRDCKENSYQVDITFHQTNITDNHIKETSNDQASQVAGTEPTTGDKAIKKKLKKQRQKLKKQVEKINQIDETKANVMEVIKEEDEITEHELQKEFVKTDCPATTSKELDCVDKHDIKDKSNLKCDSDEEIDFLNDIPAFVHAAIKKDTKKLPTTKMYKQSKQEDDVAKVNIKQTNFSLETLNNDNNEYYDIDLKNDFTLVKYKHSKHPDSVQSSEDFATLAVNLILENQIPRAIRNLSTAINLDPKNVCHYANRSFCYLRTYAYALAIKDANFVTKNTSDITILAKANYLLGEAYYGLKNYEEAERSIQKCLELFPQDLCYIRELLRFKVSQLVNMGFCERDALLALKSHSTVMDAMEILITETNIQKTNNNSTNNCDTTFMCCEETEVFYSDDEDNCSNTQLLSSIIQEKFLLQHDRINKKSNKKPVKSISKETCKITK